MSSITSPIYDASRKFLRAQVVSLSTSLLQTQREQGRILLKGTPSKGMTFRNDPYGMRVLEIREYPTPVYVRKASAAAVLEPISAAEDLTLPICRVRVEFKRGRDIYASHLDHHIGDMIVVEGDRGQDMGRVLEVLPVKGPSVARVTAYASQKDKDTLASLRKEEAAAVRLCQQRVREHGIKNMKMEDVEFQYDGQKVTIYYSSNGSVDFRQLQRQLFRDFRCRVWLRTVPASS